MEDGKSIEIPWDKVNKIIGRSNFAPETSGPLFAMIDHLSLQGRKRKEFDLLEFLYSAGLNFYRKNEYHQSYFTLSLLNNLLLLGVPPLNSNQLDLSKVWFAMGANFQGLKNYLMAYEAYSGSGMEDNCNPTPHLWAAHCLLQIGSREKAREHLKNAIEIAEGDPEFKETLKLAQNMLLKMKGNPNFKPDENALPILKGF